MNVKIDTKERFTVIRPKDAFFSANMTVELENLLLVYLKKEIPHIILNLAEVSGMENEVAEKIAFLQQEFYEKSASFIVCEMQTSVENIFEKANLLEMMNVTPTESEAWDIAQMEEIERELLGDFDDE
ncbi:MAG: STAS domain-containing protein [Ferruginibacter sp.]